MGKQNGKRGRRKPFTYSALWWHFVGLLVTKPRARIREHFRLQSAIGFRTYFDFLRTADKQVLHVTVGRFKKISVRKGTPDIEVALTSLGGEFKVVEEYLRPDFDGVIVDGGGYIGTAAIALSAMFPAAHVITIEPSEKNLEILRMNVRDWPMISVVEGALVVAGRDFVGLHDRGTGEWGFTIADSSREDSRGFLQSVRGVVLESLGNSDEIGFLKLDIEGGEFELFRESSEVLRKIPSILVELHDDIVPGCTAEFEKFSSSRQVIQTDGEKWLSVLK